MAILEVMLPAPSVKSMDYEIQHSKYDEICEQNVVGPCPVGKQYQLSFSLHRA
jgi:hypothetical protein